MAITPEQRERLDRTMNARRLELEITWRDVATRAGLSYEALRALRSGPTGIRDLTAAKISRALDWEPGSVGAVLAGGEPVNTEVSEHGIPADAPLCSFERVLLTESGLDDQTKAEIIRAHRQNGHLSCVILTEQDSSRRATALSV